MVGGLHTTAEFVPLCAKNSESGCFAAMAVHNDDEAIFFPQKFCKFKK